MLYRLYVTLINRIQHLKTISEIRVMSQKLHIAMEIFSEICEMPGSFLKFPAHYTYFKKDFQMLLANNRGHILSLHCALGNT